MRTSACTSPCWFWHFDLLTRQGSEMNADSTMWMRWYVEVPIKITHDRWTLPTSLCQRRRPRAQLLVFANLRSTWLCNAGRERQGSKTNKESRLGLFALGRVSHLFVAGLQTWNTWGERERVEEQQPVAAADDSWIGMGSEEVEVTVTCIRIVVWSLCHCCIYASVAITELWKGHFSYWSCSAMRAYINDRKVTCRSYSVLDMPQNSVWYVFFKSEWLHTFRIYSNCTLKHKCICVLSFSKPEPLCSLMETPSPNRAGASSTLLAILTSDGPVKMPSDRNKSKRNRSGGYKH